jgi:hypothetical protein
MATTIAASAETPYRMSVPRRPPPPEQRLDDGREQEKHPEGEVAGGHHQRNLPVHQPDQLAGGDQ